MRLLVDIGNSSILIAKEENAKIKKAARITTKKDEGVFYYKKAFSDYFKKNKINKSKIEIVLYCSVVPSLNSTFKKAVKALLNIKILEEGKDIEFSIENKYKLPAQVGADRLANAVAAADTYKDNNIIIVDFGTAITFDVVNKKGQYLGGLITPGIYISLESLYEQAELLPKVSLKKATSLIAKDTVASINNGIIYAAASACDGIIKRLKEKLSSPIVVLATGGYAKLIKRYSASIDKIDPYLTLEGLYLNYLKKRKKRRINKD